LIVVEVCLNKRELFSHSWRENNVFPKSVKIHTEILQTNKCNFSTSILNISKQL
jgi:hypothetical protein